MNKQEQAMARLEQQGFRFCNWIQDRMGYIPPEEEPHPDALMRKTTKGFLHEYHHETGPGRVHSTSTRCQGTTGNDARLTDGEYGMKVKCTQNRTAAIAAGIEPADGAIMVDMDLSTLTPEQRKQLAYWSGINYAMPVIAGTPAEVIAALDAAIAEDKAQAEARAKADAEILLNLPTRTLVQTEKSEYGVSFTHWATPYIEFGSPATIEAVEAREAELQAEANRLNKAIMAEVQPRIEAAKAKAEAEAKAKAEAKAARLAEIRAKRKETGIVIIPFPRDDRSEWGEPWIAIVRTQNGRRPVYDFSAGGYDAAKEELSIPCTPGTVIAYGQKNYRKPNRTVHEVRRMTDDYSLLPA